MTMIAPSAENAISSCWATRVPKAGTIRKLKASAPAIAPSVFAA